MLKKDIEMMFTNEVAAYMAMGYRVNASTMGGTQGELASIDLTNDKDIVRVLVDREHIDCRDYLFIAVYKMDSKKMVFRSGFNNTMWTSKMELVKKTSWRQISANFYCTESEYAEMRDKIRERRNRRYERYVGRQEKKLDERASKAVLSFIQRQPRCKTAKAKDINVTKVVYSDGEVAYRVNYKGKNFYLK